MNARIYFDGEVKHADARDDAEICELIDGLLLDLERIPNAWEWMTFYVGKYWLNAEVENISTCYCETGNPHIKERVWGITYKIFLKEVELMESYD